MKHKVLVFAVIFCVTPLFAAPSSSTNDNNADLRRELQHLQQQTLQLQTQLNRLQKQLVSQNSHKKTEKYVVKQTKKSMHRSTEPSVVETKSARKGSPLVGYHSSLVSIHTLNKDPESLEFYPTALVADEHVLTYIAGTPVVTSPYLGSRPAFDGSDYIVNISSINRDIRLMQQRRRLYRAYEQIGYPAPHIPIIAISGKVEPVATFGHTFASGQSTGDLTLGSGELDTAAILNDKVEAYLSLAYDELPSGISGQRVANSMVGFNMGFVNIGNLDQTPYYLTAGQLYVPFGRFSSAMVSAPITMVLGRTKSRPFIVGYKSQQDNGPFAALYGFRSDTNLNGTAAGGLNLGYVFANDSLSGELGASAISTIGDAGGLQFTGSPIGTTFAGFGSPTNGSEMVRKVPAVSVHGNLSFDRYNLTAEWVAAASRFRTQDLSFNGHGAQPQAIQLEAGMTFRAFDKPASVSLGYQWSKETLALNLPTQRVSGVFNISLWKDTVESLEYRHDTNYGIYQYANGAAPSGVINANTVGTGGATDTLLAQLGVFF